MVEKVKRGVAYYPLTFYFGLVISLVTLALIVLTIGFGWELTWDHLKSFINNNLSNILLFLTLLLGLVLISSGLAYRQVVNLPPEDYQLWLEQRATRTFFPWMTPLHDWLRLRSKIYRQWHVVSFASSFHVVILIIFTLAVVNGTVQYGQQSLLLSPLPPEGEPPPNAPTFALRNPTTTSIIADIGDTNTNETAHTLHRSDHSQVTSITSTTTSTTGTIYSHTESGLSANTQYTRHAHATNSDGAGPASGSVSLYTLANTPGTPTLAGATPTSITITVNTNGNPTSTEYAIQETNSSNFVQSNGSLGGSTVWQTYSSWGSGSGKNVTGLSVNQSYSFRIKARNGDNVETGYSGTATKATLANVPNGPTLTVVSTSSIRIKINENGNPSATEFAIYNNTAGRYVRTNGGLNNNAVWATKAQYGGTNGVVNTGLSANTDYTFTVKARNSEGVDTAFSVGATINTGAPPGSEVTPAPTPPPVTIPPGGQPPAEQLSTRIDIKEVNPTTGAYNVTVNQTVGNRQLVGQLSGTVQGSSITGQYTGQFGSVTVKGNFTGSVQAGELSGASLALTNPSDAAYAETILVSGSVTKAALPGSSTPIQVKPANVVAATTAAAAVTTTILTVPTLSSSLVTNAVAGVGSGPWQWGFFGYIPARRRRVWGQLLDARTRLPIAGVRVELMEFQKDKSLKHMMTDRTGRYGFVVDKPGSYVVIAKHALYFDYQSETLNIDDPSREIIGKDILLKANEEVVGRRVIKTARLIEFFKAMTYLHWPLLVGGTILSIYLELTGPDLLRGIILGMYLFAWVIEFNRLGKKRPYGVVVDKMSTRPQALAVVQLTRQKADNNAVVASTVTDRRGRFFFVVKRGEYNLIATKGGFAPAESVFTGETPSLTLSMQRLTEAETPTAPRA